MTPLVTIGIPCYNGAQWLRQAIDSALAQTHPSKEVIVVDDGSTDNSLLIAGAYGDHIVLRRSGHRGANVARNLVLQEALGEWVQFLDADDYLEPDKIARQLEEAKGGEDADVLYAPVWERRETENGVDHHLAGPDEKQDVFTQWLRWGLPQTGGCLWRQQALQNLGGWRADQPCCQEHELYLRALQAGLRFRYTPTAGAVYRIWSETTLCRRDPRLLVQTKTRLLDRFREWMQQKKLWTQTHARLTGLICFELARTLARSNLPEAVRYYRERRRLGLLSAEGPAAPALYRLALRCFGFAGAERLARLRRSEKP